MVEKRSTPRNEAFLKGQMQLDGPQARLNCLVCDISESGARIQVSELVDLAALPEHFLLFIPKANVTHRVRIAWRSKGEVGVSFVP